MLLRKTIFLLSIASIFAATVFAIKNHKSVIHKPAYGTLIIEETKVEKLLQKRVGELKKYIIHNGFNDSICFVINMAIPSGKPRFFVYNIKKDTTIKQGLVAHGSGSITNKGAFVFNNTPNSLASARGKYKIGVAYNGQFGLAYKLHGLDFTNNKAFERFIVLHSHECVPSETVYPQQICQSWGCPTVAPSFLLELQRIISASNKPILLDIQFMK
jgi:hypothetical protein